MTPGHRVLKAFDARNYRVATWKSFDYPERIASTTTFFRMFAVMSKWSKKLFGK